MNETNMEIRNGCGAFWENSVTLERNSTLLKKRIVSPISFTCTNLCSGNIGTRKMDGAKIANNTAKNGKVYARHD